MKYEFLEHTADVKFKAYGKTLNEAYGNVVLAMADLISKGVKIKSRKGKIIEVKGEDKESLLYNFVEEIIYLLDAENFVVVKGDVTIRGNNLRAELFGDDASEYDGLDHVKAATYAEMFVKKGKEGWEVQAVVDV